MTQPTSSITLPISELRKQATRLLNGSNAKEDIFVYIDESVRGKVSILENAFGNVKTQSLEVENSVQWQRRKWRRKTKEELTSQLQEGSGPASKASRPLPSELTYDLEDLSCVAIVFYPVSLLQLIQTRRLHAYVHHVTQHVYSQKRVIMIVEGVDEYFGRMNHTMYHQKNGQNGGGQRKVNKKAEEPEVSREKVLEALAELQISFFLPNLVCVYMTKNSTDTGQFLVCLTKYFATHGYQKVHSEVNLANCIRTGMKPRTMEEAWPIMLQQIPRVTERVALAIAAQFPSVESLYAKYEDPNLSESQKRELLKNIRVLEDPLKLPSSAPTKQAQRTLGSALSSKIYDVFMSVDPEVVV
jgi:hypothetical protein